MASDFHGNWDRQTGHVVSIALSVDPNVLELNESLRISFIRHRHPFTTTQAINGTTLIQISQVITLSRPSCFDANLRALFQKDFNQL